ncbi:hypothetical protein DMB95_08230 [Campylobacter sp. MIT 12-8780]|uniref:DUF2860 family protein n=1 Tax=unclassified Campylobacter TaxID=2593542 RepID=UPI00115E911D|nr:MULTISPECIES: DUF2860 family protein [unclassified Campylobacter]NDJ27417.1 DUF2860 domain-containing protein [Campylobacter sp. MIT 19-121]TQR40192.1 hypothetical protein DMB95_08230 [Campylobacter sp. MIT 12-8780]
MKKITSCIFLASAFLYANENFSANLSIGTGIRSIQSRLSTWADQSFLASYSDKHKDTKAAFFVNAELAYKNFLSDDKVYLKSFSGRDLSGISLGYELSYLNDYKTSFEFLSSLREKAYANPYLLSYRDEINVQRLGFKLSQNYKFNEQSNASLSYIFANNDFKNDAVSLKSLKRSGNFHQFEFAYNYSLLSVNLHYDYNDAEGRATAFQRYGFNLQAKIPLSQSYIFTPSFGYSYLKALKHNVIFNETQKAHNIKANFNLVKLGILSYKKAYAFANYGFELRDNNINFYDEQFQFLLLGLGYRF